VRYRWDIDFPLQLQGIQPTGETVCRLWFELTDIEKRKFKKQVGSRLTAQLPIELRFGQQLPKFRVAVRGRANAMLTEKRREIANFIADRLQFAHIPAVRTAEAARDIVYRLVSDELELAEQSLEFKRALQKIQDLQEPILRRVSDSIEETLKVFLPDVVHVAIRVSTEERVRALRSAYEVIVDDGTPTPLEYKGDGVQSIAALSLMRALSAARGQGRDLILAIEEPEAHLHPAAIHQLRAVLQDIVAETQIVMTTHHPVFVDRRRAANNVIVQASRARPASSIDEVRECLGVQASDNLRHAELVLIVEGDSDQLAVDALLRSESSALTQAMDAGRLVVQAAGGASRIPYHANLIRSSLCAFHILADNDEAGKQAMRGALQRGYLFADEYTLTSCRGNREAEIEDMFDPAVYSTELLRGMAVRVPSRSFDQKRGKWSARMEAAFTEQGRDWEPVQVEVKQLVAGAVAAAPRNALDPRFRGPFDALIETLSRKLDVPIQPANVA
jgi:hypothetical protein